MNYIKSISKLKEKRAITSKYSSRLIFKLFKKSEKDIEQNPSFFDEVMELDCIEVLEDARYFVFKENIQKVLKALIRDRTLKEQLSVFYHKFSLKILPHQLDLPFVNEYGL